MAENLAVMMVALMAVHSVVMLDEKMAALLVVLMAVLSVDRMVVGMVASKAVRTVDT